MEKIDEGLAFIGVDYDGSISSVRPKVSEGQLKVKGVGRKQNQHTRKLYLEYKQLMKKMAIQQRIEDREQSAHRRLQEIRNRRSQEKGVHCNTWNKIQKTICQQSKMEFRQTQQSLKKEKLAGKPHKQFSSTAKGNTFNIYHSKGKLNSGLPKIYRQKSEEVQEGVKQIQPIDLIDFGIFSERRGCEGFLRRLKGSIERQFECGLDVNSEQDVDKLQLVLLREIKGERWLTEH